MSKIIHHDYIWIAKNVNQMLFSLEEILDHTETGKKADLNTPQLIQLQTLLQHIYQLSKEALRLLPIHCVPNER